MKIIVGIKVNTENTLRYHETSFPDPNVEEWRGVTVFGEFQSSAGLHPLTLELLEEAREMAAESGDKAQLLLIGNGLVETARKYYAQGADRVFVYDDPSLAAADSERYLRIMAHFIDNYKPAAILFPETELGVLLQKHILDHAEANGNALKVQMIQEGSAAGKAPDPDHLGELVICEIP